VTGRDAADSDRLAEAIKGITAAPDHFDRLEGPDLAAGHREACVAELGAPLPEQGWGLERVHRPERPAQRDSGVLGLGDDIAHDLLG